MVQTEFWDLRIGMTAADVRFRKGKPTTEKDGIWVCRDAENKGYVDHFYVAAIGSDDKIRYVLAVTTGDPVSNLPELQGITERSTLDDIERRFGPPDHVSISSDGLRRMLSYKQFNVCFRLEKNLVTASGLCDGSMGPLKFIEEQDGGTQGSSKK